MFPHVRAEVLRILFSSSPRRERYVREIARESTFSLRTVQLELATLSAVGLLKSRTDGYHRFYRANAQHPLCALLRQLVTKAAGERAFVNRRKKPRQGWRGPKRRARPLQRFRMSMGLSKLPST